MAEKPTEEGYISVVDEEPEIFELLKWDSSQQTQKQQQQNQTSQVQINTNTINPPQEKIHEKRNSKARDDIDPFDLPDDKFIDKFRLSKDLVRNLCEELKPVMSDTVRFLEFPVESKVLAALLFYATGKYQKAVCGKMDPNKTQYFVSTSVLQVTDAMNHPDIVKKYIHFPHLKQERDVIKARFYMKYGMPSVVGSVDCTHVPMHRPEDDHKSHYNKAYHSKKVQIISDSDCNILSVEADAGGSLSHDMIMNGHPVKNDLESLGHSGEECWLIGSAHYAQKPYLMTPIPKISKKNPLSPEKYYTKLHSQTHSTVAETIKQLKSRFKCLQILSSRPFEPCTISLIVVACSILHNMCNRRGLSVIQMTPAEERLEIMKQKVANAPIPRKTVEDNIGVEARVRLMERLWNERVVNPEMSGKKRKKDTNKVVVSHAPEPQPQPIHQQPIHNSMQEMSNHHHHLLQNHHSHHQLEDPNKRPRILMNTPTYTLGVNPGWGHFPPH